MTIPVRVHGCAGRAPLGEDLGLFRGSFDGTGTAPQSALLDAPWSSGRTLALTGGEVRVRIPVGQPKFDGASAVGSSTGPKSQPGIEPRAVTAMLNIARVARSFKPKDLGREQSLR